MNSLSVLLSRDCISGSSSPVTSIIWKSVTNSHALVKSSRDSESKLSNDPPKELMFILTKDSKVVVIDGCTGNMTSPGPMHLKKQSTAISMYVIGKCNFNLGSNNQQCIFLIWIEFKIFTILRNSFLVFQRTMFLYLDHQMTSNNSHPMMLLLRMSLCKTLFK